MFSSNSSHSNQLTSFYNRSNEPVYSTHLPVVYRVQEALQFFNLATLLLGIYSSYQSTPTIQDIVQHQKSTIFVGTTDDAKIAYTIAQERKESNLILTIDPNFFELINVNETVRHRTSYYPPFDEREHATLLIPICAIKEITFLNQNITLANPLYIASTPLNIGQYKNIYRMHRNFLNKIFEHGKQMSPIERSQLLFNLVASYTNFYDGKMLINPFRAKIGTLANMDPVFRFFLGNLVADKAVIEL